MDDDFTEDELSVHLAQLKVKSAPGPDKIKNLHLLNLPIIGKKILLKIINSSWNNQIILED